MAPTTTTTCNVCCESTRKTNKIVVCEKCEFEACSVCTEKYIIMSMNEPQCMNCHHLWDNVFLHKYHTKACISRIRTSQKDRLFNLETTLLPETQQFLPLYNELPELNRQLDARRVELSRINRQNRQDFNPVNTARRIKDYYAIAYENALTNDRIRRITRIINGETDVMYMENEEQHEDDTSEQFTKVRNEYVKKCGKDDCNGYINKRTYKCGVCESEICKHCWVEKTEDEEHVCKDDDVASTKILLKESKPCPECYALIHRISGCTHMFCTQCNTAFDWRTGEIHKNGNTNPHYYAWLQSRPGSSNQNGQHLNNRNCDQRMSIRDVIHSIQHHFKKLSKTEQDNIIKTFRNFDHIQHFERPYVFTEQDRVNHNRPLRIKFLTKQINEKDLKTKLMRTYKANECNIHKRQLADMVGEVQIDFMNRFIQRTDTGTQLYKEIMEFKNYISTCYSKIESVYGLKCYKFST